MNTNPAPATKQDLVDLETRIEQRMTAQESRLVEHMRDMETRLLNACSFDSTCRKLYPFLTQSHL